MINILGVLGSREGSDWKVTARELGRELEGSVVEWS